MPAFGQEGTVLLLGGLTFHALVCALLLQPVSRHVKKNKIADKEMAEIPGKKVRNQVCLQ